MTDVRVDDLNEQIADLPPAKRALLELRLKQKNLGTAAGHAISPRSNRNSAPLSFTQQRLWFLNELDPSNSAYNISHAFRVKGALNVSALEKALNAIVRRHEALRTRFAMVNGEGVQLIDATGSVSLSIVDFSKVPAAEQDAEVHRWAAEASKLPFDLSSGPLFRASLLRLASEEHVLLTTIHHIVSDGWSMRVLFKELSALYEAFANGRSSPLAELSIQYADFALWQREALQSDLLATQLTYWQKKLQGAPAVLDLPADRPRPAVNLFRGAKKSFELSQSLTKALNELSRREGVTLFMTLLAAFKTLLWRYTGREDIVVGLPIAGRNRPEIEGLVGFFINTLALRTDLSGNPSFLQVLSRVCETTLEAYANQDLPFERLVEALQPERSLSHTPLVQVMLTFQHAPPARLDLNGLKVESVGLENQTSKFDLTIFALESDKSLKFTLEYNTDLFDDARIERMAEHFKVLLANIVARPNARISELELLPDAERQRLLVEWNQTTLQFPEKCVHRMFEEQANRNPGRIAVAYEDEKLTYAELNARANQLARYLRSLGVGPETVVGICIERSLEMVIGLLGILKAGGAYLPLDPALPQERLTFMMEDADVPVLVTLTGLSQQLPPHQAKVVALDGEQEAIARERDENLEAGVTGDNLAYVIYTSGSTGRPKGTMNTQRGLCNRLQWMQTAYRLTEADRVLQKTPYSFDVSVWEFFWPLISGARLVMARPGGHQDPGYLVDMIQQEQISTLHFVPSMMQAFVEAKGVEQCESLRQVISSGEALSYELQERFFERLKCQLHNLYGPTEASIDVTAWECRPGGEARTVPIGRPLANTQIYILDERLEPVPIGVAGELHIGGTGVGRGYLNRPELTAEKFVPDPWAAGRRLYKSGDLARYRADGSIEYLGRLDDQVKIRGFRIELGEIESVLCQYAGVSMSAVVMHTDLTGGDRLLAYVVGQQAGVNSKELREYLRKKLPEYMLPAAIVEMEELPLTPSGKIDRRALPAPQQLRSDLETRFEAPQTPTEEVLASIWSEILKVEPIGIHDNFFHLGGHSLLAVQVISRMRAVFGTEMPLPLFFESPTIAALADRIEKGMRDEAGLQPPPLVRTSRQGDLPLSFAQQRLWLLDQLEQGSWFYHISKAFRLRGKLNVEALSSALNEIVRRHEPLRTSFVSVGGMPFQRIEEPQPVPISLFDIELIPESDRDNEARRLAMLRIRKPFDLSCGPFLRASLIRTSQEECVLVLTMHHIAGDAWSLSILFKELSVLYAAFAQRIPCSLPDLKIQFADFAVWQRSWLQEEILEKHLSYWKQQLAGAPLVLELPTDKPRPSVQTFSGARFRFELSPELTEGLRTLSKREGVTLFMTCLAAFQLLLSRYTGQTELVVGTDFANRNQVETEAMIGFFVNLLPLRISLSENPILTELLQQVREVTLRAYAHQDLPFDRLVAELRQKRDLSRNPLVQVLLVMQNTPAQELEMQGLTLESFELPTENSRFDLALFFWESGDKISGTFLYNPDLFHAGTIARMAKHFETLLGSIIEDPSSRLDSFKMKTDEELRNEVEEKREHRQLQVHNLRGTRRRSVDLSSVSNKEGTVDQL